VAEKSGRGFALVRPPEPLSKVASTAQHILVMCDGGPSDPLDFSREARTIFFICVLLSFNWWILTQISRTLMA
jgi:hypothetical protein